MVNVGWGACKYLIIPLCVVGLPIFVVFYGGLHGWYSTDIRIAIGWMIGAFNIATLPVFAFDKAASQFEYAQSEGHGCRVPEVVLLFIAWAGGPIGAILGVLLFNHKRSKSGFMAILCSLFVFNWLWVFIYFIATAETSLAGAFEHHTVNNFNNSIPT